MKKEKFSKAIVALGALVAVGAGIGFTGLVGAQEVTSTTSTTAAPSAITTTSVSEPQRDPHLGGHIGQNGTKEELLTGDIAAKVTAAALLAQPGATIQRVENDAEGATYEAHITKADGTDATLKFDANYAVTATESGHGHR